MTETLTLRQLNRATLARQMLLERERLSAVAAVERLAGMQAQVARPPFVGLWTRVEGFQREELHAALHEREIVRGTLMRGTLHMMSANDYIAHRMALQPMLTTALRGMLGRSDGLELERVLEAARTLLAKEPRTFSELRPLLRERFPDIDERRLSMAVRGELPLIMVPTADRWDFPAVARFTLAATWLPEPLSEDRSPQALALRYLAAFGPASAADAQVWSGMSGLKAVLDELRPQLRVFQDEQGRELFDLPAAPRPAADVPAPPRFMPEFENLVLSHADRSRVLTERHRQFMASKNGMVPATFLWDGFVAGIWKIERKKFTATLHLTPFESLPKAAMNALVTEGEALLRVVEEDMATYDVQVDEPRT